MKSKYFFLSAVVIVGLLSASVCRVWAGAPATAKIAYSSRRDGEYGYFSDESRW